MEVPGYRTQDKHGRWYTLVTAVQRKQTLGRWYSRGDDYLAEYRKYCRLRDIKGEYMWRIAEHPDQVAPGSKYWKDAYLVCLLDELDEVENEFGVVMP